MVSPRKATHTCYGTRNKIFWTPKLPYLLWLALLIEDIVLGSLQAPKEIRREIHLFRAITTIRQLLGQEGRVVVRYCNVFAVDIAETIFNYIQNLRTKYWNHIRNIDLSHSPQRQVLA